MSLARITRCGLTATAALLAAGALLAGPAAAQVPPPPELPDPPAEAGPVVEALSPVTTYVCVAQSGTATLVVLAGFAASSTPVSDQLNEIRPYLFLPSAVCRLAPYVKDQTTCSADDQVTAQSKSVRVQLTAALATVTTAAASAAPQAAAAGLVTGLVSPPPLPTVGAVVDVSRMAQQLVEKQSGQALPASVADTVAGALSCKTVDTSKASAPSSPSSGTPAIPPLPAVPSLPVTESVRSWAAPTDVPMGPDTSSNLSAAVAAAGPAEHTPPPAAVAVDLASHDTGSGSTRRWAAGIALLLLCIGTAMVLERRPVSG